MQPITYKRIGVVAVVLIIAVLFWVTAQVWLERPDQFSSWAAIWPPSLILIAFMAVVGLAFLLLDAQWWRLGVIVAGLVPFLFTFGINGLYALGLLIAAALWWLAAATIRRELRERRAIRATSIVHHSTSRVVLGIFILLSFAFYLLPSNQNVTAASVQRSFAGTISGTSNTLLADQLARLPAADRAQVAAEVSSEAARTLGTFLNKQICLTDAVCTPSFLEMLPSILAFLFFLALMSVGFFFRELAVPVAGGLFLLLQTTKFVTIAQEDAKVEVLRI